MLLLYQDDVVCILFCANGLGKDLIHLFSANVQWIVVQSGFFSYDNAASLTEKTPWIENR